jgi:ribosomal protein S7
MQKLINHLLISGKKKTSENNLVKISKNLQKLSGKSFNNIIKLVIVSSTIIFKVSLTEKKTNKKKIFNLLQKNKTRISLSIKYLINITKTEKAYSFNKKFCNKIFSLLKNNDNIIVKKSDLQSQISLNKHLFFYYR